MKTQKPSDQHRYRNSAALLLAALACSGCAVGPDFQRPQAPAVNSYTRAPLPATMTSAAVKVDRQWWTAFGSPALNDLVEQAFRHNPGIDSARAALRQAQESTAAQWGSYFPTIQAGYAPSRQKNAVGTISPTLTSGQPLYTLHTAQLSISYAPDVFGLNRRTVESLAAQEETQRFQLQAAYLTLASNVVAAAIQQAALGAQIHATEGVIAAAAKSLAALRHQAGLGFASELDVATQEAALAQAQQSLPPLSRQLEQTRNLLAVLTGSFPAQGGIDDIALDALQLPAPLPLSLPSQLVQQRPDVRAAEAQMHAASAEVGVATANRLPQISISALYGGSATQFSKMFSNDNKFWGLTGNITQTVFDFGTLQHRQRAADAALEQANAQYRSVVLAAFQNVADTLYALDADARTLSAAEATETATRKTLDLTQKQLDLGFVNALVLLNAEQAYQQAKVARIQAIAMRYTDTAAMYQALGGGWEE
ncbi:MULTISPECIES: efflux transporter outer membrane subunit [unclassified Janthinobacterium]|uniref:efflux transporter outer membrane subunit n=1 Tax=unclassified Janthinobacterium TaxID=2610881 RepID=UPI001616ABE6|nr:MULTISPECIES: efflux transporter outer membrane subunit [unclassified Janthinobacterium]MBB5368880.1 NodT family efflux transporter outer membrane factor (OMF) lipoprotein [Janthinobacterium sp. K2C7]MBB5381584.1 NodT family efflux transporter outer membrane factor (OMF) lipoprotein [Janthinobacterium sp. K2Li3]MBB5387262.1 NodT family efflux transporter outer membrane factor (OMF) lipoprotein [Janthinobacterium sp. K2E3]